LPPFNPTYQGKPLFSESLDPPSGAFGFAAEYELVRVARWRGYSWEQFDALDSDSQALIVAEYRIETRFAAVDSYQQSLKRKPRTRASAKGRR
jgi:hypothetical protein